VIDEAIAEEVRRRLDHVEMSEGVRILLAVESGSRAWGFPSRDSDYDVRFVYIHPPEWYLSVDADLHRDVIERPILDEIDLSGWEIRKALLLFAKSNPPLLEWLSSPLVYRDTKTLASRLRDLLPAYYAPNASLYHYLHMAQGNFKDYLRGDVVWVKKYFYVLRPLLAVRWIEQGRGPVPICSPTFSRRFRTSRRSYLRSKSFAIGRWPAKSSTVARPSRSSANSSRRRSRASRSFTRREKSSIRASSRSTRSSVRFYPRRLIERDNLKLVSEK
jgi:predicted nucleotidyltransferase